MLVVSWFAVWWVVVLFSGLVVFGLYNIPAGCVGVVYVDWVCVRVARHSWFLLMGLPDAWVLWMLRRGFGCIWLFWVILGCFG